MCSKDLLYLLATSSSVTLLKLQGAFWCSPYALDRHHSGAPCSSPRTACSNMLKHKLKLSMIFLPKPMIAIQPCCHLDLPQRAGNKRGNIKKSKFLCAPNWTDWLHVSLPAAPTPTPPFSTLRPATGKWLQAKTELEKCPTTSVVKEALPVWSSPRFPAHLPITWPRIRPTRTTASQIHVRSFSPPVATLLPARVERCRFRTTPRSVHFGINLQHTVGHRYVRSTDPIWSKYLWLEPKLGKLTWLNDTKP